MTLLLLLEQIRTVSNFYLSPFSCLCYIMVDFVAGCLVLVYITLELTSVV